MAMTHMYPPGQQLWGGSGGHPSSRLPPVRHRWIFQVTARRLHARFRLPGATRRIFRASAVHGVIRNKNAVKGLLEPCVRS